MINIRKFVIDCVFSDGNKHPVNLYVGEPAIDSPALYFQSKWLSEKKGGMIPKEVIESFDKIKKISVENKIPFLELVDFVIEEINSSKSLKKDAERSFEISKSDKKL